MTQNETAIHGCQYTSYFNRSLVSNAAILVVARSIQPSLQHQSSAPFLPFSMDTGIFSTEETPVFFENFTLPKYRLEYRLPHGIELVCAFVLGGQFYPSDASKVYGNPGRSCFQTL